jgi:hypothetical protein
LTISWQRNKTAKVAMTTLAPPGVLRVEHLATVALIVLLVLPSLVESSLSRNNCCLPAFFECMVSMLSSPFL